jgi:hypothetical protein
VKVVAMTKTTHNPFNETHRVSCLRENLTSSSEGEGLETGCALSSVPRQSFTRQEAFFMVKRVLDLSYLWTGSENGVLLQVWSTWLFFAGLVDLGDALADEMELEFDRISLEMVMRGLYHFSVARQRGLADDPVKYFAAPENQDLGVVKRLRKKRPSRAGLSPSKGNLTIPVFA